MWLLYDRLARKSVGPSLDPFSPEGRIFVLASASSTVTCQESCRRAPSRPRGLLTIWGLARSHGCVSAAARGCEDAESRRHLRDQGPAGGPVRSEGAARACCLLKTQLHLALLFLFPPWGDGQGGGGGAAWPSYRWKAASTRTRLQPTGQKYNQYSLFEGLSCPRGKKSSADVNVADSYQSGNQHQWTVYAE